MVSEKSYFAIIVSSSYMKKSIPEPNNYVDGVLKP
jgi:hypothetical protein